MRRFELSEGTSNKFWQVERDDASVTVCFGRIGTSGQSQVKSFASATAAQAEMDKLIKEKTKKGYAEVAAAAGATSPAPKPVAPKPVAAPPPAAAPASVQSTPIESAPARPATAAVGTIAWTDAALRSASPIRGRDTIVPRKPDAKHLHSKIAAAMKAFAPLLDAGRSMHDADKARMDAARAAYAGAMPEKLDPEAEAAAFALIGPCVAWNDTSRTEDFIGYWLATEGPVFALRTLALALPLNARATNTDITLPANGDDKERPWFRTRGREDWRGIRLAAALADDVTYAALVKEAEGLLEGPSIERRALLAVAFERPEWIESDIATIAATAHPPDYFWPLLASAPSLEEAKALCARVPQANVWYLAAGMDRLRFDMVARYGVAAGAFLCDIVAQAGSSGVDRMRSIAEAIALVVTPEVAAFFVKQLGAKELRAIAAQYLQSHPQVSVVPLAQAAVNKGPLGESAKAVLKPIVASGHGAVNEARVSLAPAAQNVIAQLEEQTRPRPQASPDELPSFLRTPPWTVKTKGAAPTVLALTPLPFAETMAWKPGEEKQRAGGRWLEEQPEKVAENLTKVKERSASAPTPTERSWNMLNASIFANLPKKELLEILPSLNLGRFNWSYYGVASTLVARHGVDMIPFALRSAEVEGLGAVEALQRANAARVAPLMADALARLKKARPTAAEWLAAFPEAAAMGLVPAALGKPGRDRANAEAALRFVASRGHRAIVEAAAAKYGAEASAGVTQILDFDPLLTVPTKIPKLPTFWNAAGFTAPLLRGGQKALPPSAIDAIGTMLAFTSTDDPYVGIAAVKEACEPASLADFAWDVFQAWLVAGAPSKEAWALHALGFFGDDDAARKLTPLVRAWPGEAAHARAVIGLDVLARIGTDVALMHLHGIAQKLKFKGLQEKAGEKIEQIAEARGLSAEELADRLVPDLGLDDNGSLTLDFGPRAFRVVFDEALKPAVLDEQSKRLPDLPKAKQTDDAEKAKEATERWKALKKDAKTIATGQICRLEIAMCAQRRWPAAVFRQFLLEHPLLVHVVRRLVWGVYDDAGKVRGSFRVAEDASLANEKDDAFDLADDAQVGIVHRLDLDDAAAAAWGQVLSDYEIIQPFTQLSREIAVPTDADRAAKKLDRVVGLEVPTGKVLGLDDRGWRRGPPQDGGVVCWYEKPLAGGLMLYLDLDPGIFTGMISESPKQKLGSVTLNRGEYLWSAGDTSLPFGDLAPIPFSELLRDLDSLRG